MGSKIRTVTTGTKFSQYSVMRTREQWAHFGGKRDIRRHSIERRSRYITLPWLPWFVDLNKPWSCRYDRNSEKVDMHDFPVHDYTQEQNDSPYFSSIVWQSKWKIALIQKFCCLGNLTSHFSSPITLEFSENKTFGFLLDEDWVRDFFNTSSVRASELASFWRENAIDVVVLLRAGF